MTSTTDAPATSLNGSRSVRPGNPPSAMTAAAVRLPSGRPKTPPGMLALAVLLMLGCGAAAGALVLAADASLTVLAAARELPAGTVITAQDLRAAELSGSGLAAIPADKAGTLLGKTVLGAVPAGTLLNAGMVASAPPPGRGKIAVGLALEASQLPAAELTAARQVEIYRLPASTDAVPAAGNPDLAGAQQPTAGAGQVLVPRAQVLSVTPGSTGGFLVTVEVDAALAAEVSTAGASGRVAVGLLPVGS
jgi:hypothetical protein